MENIKMTTRQEMRKKFFNTYSGIKLLEKYRLSEFGTWQIYGEDNNPDWNSSHHEPLLKTVQCTLSEAIDYAVSIDGFFTWGAGGSIKKIEIVTPYTGRERSKVPNKALLCQELNTIEKRLKEIIKELDEI